MTSAYIIYDMKQGKAPHIKVAKIEKRSNG